MIQLLRRLVFSWIGESFPVLGKNQVNLSCMGLLPFLYYSEFLPTTLRQKIILALDNQGQGPRHLLGHALVTLSRYRTHISVYVCSYCASWVGSYYFSVCSLHILKPSQPTGCEIQLCQNTCKILVWEFFKWSRCVYFYRNFFLFFFWIA